MPLLTVAGTVIVEVRLYDPTGIWTTGCTDDPVCSAFAAFVTPCWTEQGATVVQAVPDPVGDVSKTVRPRFGGVPGRIGGRGLIAARGTTWSSIEWPWKPTPDALNVSDGVIVKMFPIENRSP